MHCQVESGPSSSMDNIKTGEDIEIPEYQPIIKSRLRKRISRSSAENEGSHDETSENKSSRGWRVDAKDERGEWMDGKIVTLDESQVRIHYMGFRHDFDLWVSYKDVAPYGTKTNKSSKDVKNAWDGSIPLIPERQPIDLPAFRKGKSRGLKGRSDKKSKSKKKKSAKNKVVDVNKTSAESTKVEKKEVPPPNEAPVGAELQRRVTRRTADKSEPPISIPNFPPKISRRTLPRSKIHIVPPDDTVKSEENSIDVSGDLSVLAEVSANTHPESFQDAHQQTSQGKSPSLSNVEVSEEIDPNLKFQTELQQEQSLDQFAQEHNDMSVESTAASALLLCHESMNTVPEAIGGVNSDQGDEIKANAMNLSVNLSVLAEVSASTHPDSYHDGDSKSERGINSLPPPREQSESGEDCRKSHTQMQRDQALDNTIQEQDDMSAESTAASVLLLCHESMRAEVLSSEGSSKCLEDYSEVSLKGQDNVESEGIVLEKHTSERDEVTINEGSDDRLSIVQESLTTSAGDLEQQVKSESPVNSTSPVSQTHPVKTEADDSLSPKPAMVTQVEEDCFSNVSYATSAGVSDATTSSSVDGIKRRKARRFSVPISLKRLDTNLVIRESEVNIKLSDKVRTRHSRKKLIDLPNEAKSNSPTPLRVTRNRSFNKPHEGLNDSVSRAIIETKKNTCGVVHPTVTDSETPIRVEQPCNDSATLKKVSTRNAIKKEQLMSRVKVESGEGSKLSLAEMSEAPGNLSYFDPNSVVNEQTSSELMGGASNQVLNQPKKTRRKRLRKEIDDNSIPIDAPKAKRIRTPSLRLSEMQAATAYATETPSKYARSERLALVLCFYCKQKILPVTSARAMRVVPPDQRVCYKCKANPSEITQKLVVTTNPLSNNEFSIESEEKGALHDAVVIPDQQAYSKDRVTSTPLIGNRGSDTEQATIKKKLIMKRIAKPRSSMSIPRANLSMSICTNDTAQHPEELTADKLSSPVSTSIRGSLGPCQLTIDLGFQKFSVNSCRSHDFEEWYTALHRDPSSILELRERNIQAMNGSTEALDAALATWKTHLNKK